MHGLLYRFAAVSRAFFVILSEAKNLGFVV